MRRGTIKSDLIKTIGWDANQMDVEYRSDLKVFRYFGVSLATFKALVRSKHPGEDWIAIRDQYKFKQV
jgi:hypothetical protein